MSTVREVLDRMDREMDVFSDDQLMSVVYVDADTDTMLGSDDYSSKKSDYFGACYESYKDAQCADATHLMGILLLHVTK